MQSPANQKQIDWEIIYPGLIDYATGLELQEKYWNAVKNGGKFILLLLEHQPVITLGRRTDPSHLLLSETELKERGIELFHANRGGSATYHGPGQLVGYIICKSSRYGGIHSVVERALKSINRVMNNFEIKSYIDYENPGVWTNTEPPRKLAAVGMSNKDGYTMHGFAINVDLPLTGFSAIVPCGLTLPVSTMSIEIGKRIDLSQVENDFIKEFEMLFQRK